MVWLFLSWLSPAFSVISIISLWVSIVFPLSPVSVLNCSQYCCYRIVQQELKQDIPMFKYHFYLLWSSYLTLRLLQNADNTYACHIVRNIWFENVYARKEFQLNYLLLLSIQHFYKTVFSTADLSWIYLYSSVNIVFLMLLVL